MKHIYNLKRQKKDKRDFHIKQILMPHKEVTYPAVCSMRYMKYNPPIFDQGNLGSCTANAGIRAANILNKMQPSLRFSRLYQYWYERYIEGDVGQDGGASMRDIGKAMLQFGLCEEQFDPYDITKFTKTPSATAKANARTHKIKGYHAVTTLDEIRQTISLLAQAVMIGMDVYQSFENVPTVNTGIVSMPKKGEKCLGSHAVCIIGYDDNNQWLEVANSWGVKYDDKGYIYIPYSYFNAGFAYDMWVLQ